jgi:hypothetical protein
MLENAAGVVMDVAKVAKLATERATSIGEVEGEARSCVRGGWSRRRTRQPLQSRWRRQEGEAATAQPRSIAAVVVTRCHEGALGAQARGSTISFDDEDAAKVREEDAFSGVKSELLAQDINGFSGADITKI